MREPALPPTVPQPLDRELLAWAAGFFDGEGTTLAKNQKRRPNYRQLQVSVPQSGNGRVPDVLERFRRAALGTGRIGPPNADGIYAWRARGRVDAETTLALIWPYLGVVKREQATAALELVESQYARITRRDPKYLPAFVPHADTATSEPDKSRLDRAWAAGFLDAEGWFGVVLGRPRKDGSPTYRIRVSAPQHSYDGAIPEVLHRMREIFGGAIECHGDPDDYKWVVYGRERVARILELATPWLGTIKLAQAREAFAKFDSQRRLRGNGMTCLRGHTYDGIVVRRSGKTVKVCNSCDRLRDRANRAARGGKPRSVRNQPRDQTRKYRVK